MFISLIPPGMLLILSLDQQPPEPPESNQKRDCQGVFDRRDVAHEFV
jgi:hypothetical protein